ncbi:MAG: AsmA family protein [Kiritimatiellia bacterium]|nr:AsmA family protein [Kiritimatiellia bacterium]
MNETVKKSLKLTGKIALWALGVIVVLLLILPLWIGPVVKGVANSVVPGIVGTEFHLGEFGLNPYTGCLHVGDLQLANPTNYAKENCVELEALDINLAMTSLFSKKLRIEEIVVKTLRVSSTAGGGNFMQIAENASGESEEEVKADLEKIEEAEAKAEAKAAKEDGQTVVEEKSEGGLQIDRLVIDGLTVKVGVVPVPVPKLTIEGIGADSEEGASYSEVGATIWKKIQGSMTAVGGAVVDGATAVGGAVVDGAGKAASAVADGVGAAASKIGEGAGKAVDAMKNLLK